MTKFVKWIEIIITKWTLKTNKWRLIKQNTLSEIWNKEKNKKTNWRSKSFKKRTRKRARKQKKRGSIFFSSRIFLEFLASTFFSDQFTRSRVRLASAILYSTESFLGF